MANRLRKFQQLPMLRSQNSARAPKYGASETAPYTPAKWIFDGEIEKLRAEVFFPC